MLFILSANAKLSYFTKIYKPKDVSILCIHIRCELMQLIFAASLIHFLIQILTTFQLCQMKKHFFSFTDCGLIFCHLKDFTQTSYCREHFDKYALSFDNNEYKVYRTDKQEL